MGKPKVLVVLTSQSTIGDTEKKSGWYLPELAHPYYVLAPHADITVASLQGGEAPLDPSSVEGFKEDEESQKFLKDQQDLWKKTEKLESFKGRAGEFDAILYVGGHGPMFDLAPSTVSQEVIREFYEAGKTVSAVCHGPAALVNVKLSDGNYLISGSQVTSFTNAEEDKMGFSGEMPFMLETELNKNSGGNFVKADPFQSKVVVSGKNGKLITGQNPASARDFGEAVLKSISAAA